MVALVEAAQPLEDLRRLEQPVEALGLDPQPVVERAAEAARGRLHVGADRGLGQGGDRVGELDRPSRHVPVGTTSLTRPMRSASWASMTRPVMMSSIARR